MSDSSPPSRPRLPAGLSEPPPAGAPDAWPRPVRIHTLGRFEIRVDDARLEFGRKLPKRPLSLLKFLIARGGRARMEQVTDALWSDDEGDAAAGALDVALHRLRRLLGRTQSIEFQDGVLSLDRAIVWVDAFAMDSEAREAGSGTLEQARMTLRYYTGHFLPGDESEPWSMAMRERLHAHFRRMALRVGQDLQDQGRFDAALKHFEDAIEVDEIAESLYQGLMRCSLVLGQRETGLAAYRRLQRVLQGESGLLPSAESEALLLALRGASA